jgi:hypothetical protein
MKKPPNKASKSKRWAHSIVAAAQELRVTRRSLQRWIHEDGTPGKDAAGRFNLAEWRAWMAENKARLVEDKAAKGDAPAPLSRKQQIAIELAEETLKKAKRENADAESRTMETEDVDGLIFEVLANFDYHLSNAERALALKFAGVAKIAPVESRKIVKPVFDGFRHSFRDHPLPPEAKREINAWLAIPFAMRERIITGKFPAKGKKG